MAKTIAVSDEVYTLLKKTRMPKESFSKVIKRSLRKVSRLSDIAGSKTISKAAWKAAQDKITDAEKITSFELAGR
jgi:predicted CopG family antitoxin